jgi:hypothetical protein
MKRRTATMTAIKRYATAEWWWWWCWWCVCLLVADVFVCTCNMYGQGSEETSHGDIAIDDAENGVGDRVSVPFGNDDEVTTPNLVCCCLTW